MFERFTERARQVIVIAQDEARALRHSYIGTEHLLLGLLREEEGLGSRTLVAFGLTEGWVRERIVQIVGEGEIAIEGQIPFTPRSKKVLELALREALSMGHNYIGTEHLLLAFMRESEGVGWKLLAERSITPDGVRNAIIRSLSGPGRVQIQKSAELADLVRNAKDCAIDEGNYEAAARLREIERELRA